MNCPHCHSNYVERTDTGHCAICGRPIAEGKYPEYGAVDDSNAPRRRETNKGYPKSCVDCFNCVVCEKNGTLRCSQLAWENEKKGEKIIILPRSEMGSKIRPKFRKIFLRAEKCDKFDS